MNPRLLVIAAFAFATVACGSSQTATPPSEVAAPAPAPPAPTPAPTPPAPAPAPPVAPAAAPPTLLDCGTVETRTPVAAARKAYQCLVDAFAAGKDATVKRNAVSTEGGEIITVFRVIPGASGATVEVQLDDRDDRFSGAPGIHTQHCRSIKIEKTRIGVILTPDGCT